MMYYYAAPAMFGGDKARARQIGEAIAASGARSRLFTIWAASRSK